MPKSTHQTRIAILPRHGVFAVLENPELGKRFCSLFQHVWKRIPLGARRKILDDFRIYDASSESFNSRLLTGKPISVRVALRKRLEGTRAGYFNPNARLCVYSEKILVDAGDGVFENVVAHELGHAYLWATGKGEECAQLEAWDYATNPDSYKDDPEELEVRKLMKQWGFDESAYDRWCCRRGGLKARRR